MSKASEYILVTGSAGFIGFHTSKKLLSLNYMVIGIDNLNDYYDPNLKKERLKILKKNRNFFFKKLDISNYKNLNKVFKKFKITKIINLAAQAGVRYSIENRNEYFKSNIVGFYNILELSTKYKIKHLLYASTSSVYGNQKKFPVSENADTDKPLSFYSASKKTNEILAYSYSNIFKLPTSGMRFFTVYGPYGRPDMALFKFTKSMLSNRYFKVFNNGKHSRDFTYIDDIVDMIIKILSKPPMKKQFFYEIYNLGNTNPVKLNDFIKIISSLLKIKPKIKFLPLQPGDVEKTYSDSSKVQNKMKIRPKTNVKKGVTNFINWYLEFYNKN